ncbi:hypothetical protein S83_048372 [Arachis hypogaea]|nr:uncharacterized protein DS421_14g474860 [Arachis hypogaea]
MHQFLSFFYQFIYILCDGVEVRRPRESKTAAACMSGGRELLCCSVLVERGREGNEQVDIAAMEVSLGRNDEEVGGRVFFDDMVRMSSHHISGLDGASSELFNSAIGVNYSYHVQWPAW